MVTKCKFFIGHQQSEIVTPLCIILPEMSGYIKYFENSSKNMSFFITLMSLIFAGTKFRGN